MKRILHILLALTAIVGSASAQSLSVQPIEVQVGEQTEMVINLTGGATATALQFNLQLPEGISVDAYSATLGSATDGHSLNVEPLNNGDLLFILYSMNLNTFKDGEVLRIPININGEGTARLYNIRFADTDAVSYAGKETATGIKTLSNSPLKGENIYNLSGQQMVNGKSLNSKLPWGIYIKGGKKILAK